MLKPHFLYIFVNEEQILRLNLKKKICMVTTLKKYGGVLGTLLKE